MKIISAKDADGNDLTQEQIKVDLPQLERMHDEASHMVLTWAFFGGMVTVNGHTYQVS